MDVIFYYDVVCPYAYLASTRIEALARRHGATIHWTPILLGGIFRERQAPQRPRESMSAAKARLVDLDLQRWAELWNVPLVFPSAHPRRTVNAMRLLVATEPSRRPALSRALFEAYWVRGEDVADPSVLGRIAAQHGTDADVVAEPAVREALFATTRQAVEHGVFGVPAFVMEDRLWWGQDRLWMLERALGGANTDPAAPMRTVGTPTFEGAHLRFFHDFSSPFSYLASTQIERVAAHRGVAVEWVPILLGALFREIGTPDVPLFGMSPAKQAWIGRDLEDWARAWNVPFRFPSHFPIRTVLPLRVALVEPAATAAIYRAAWAEDRRIDTPETLGPVLEEAGFEAAALLSEAERSAVKDALRATTDLARERGVCGVPTFEVARHDGGSLLIWGQDRLGVLATVLDGWWPRADAARPHGS